jgi:uncharacterized protein (TIGR02145 family)
VKKVIITKPDEWKVSLSDTQLSITAPASDHATCADSKGEVVLLYFNEAYQSRYVSLNVAIAEPEVSATPKITIPTDFTTGNVQKAVYQGKQVAEICLEYVRTDAVDQQMTVIYPMTSDGVADLTKGIDVATGGSVVWDLSANTCTYTAGTGGPISTFYVGDSGELLTSYDGDVAEATVSAELLRDVRGTEIQEYCLAKIGTQYWMAESLRAEKFVDGTDISTDWQNTNGAYIYLNESADDWKDVYGTMYSGYTIYANAEALAPQGWKIPSADDMTALKTYIGTTTPGLKLRSTTGWSKNPGTNITGFNALPGMYYAPSSEDSFGSSTADVVFWTATSVVDLGTNSLVYYRFYDGNNRFTFDPSTSSFAATFHALPFGHYVRCLRK